MTQAGGLCQKAIELSDHVLLSFDVADANAVRITLLLMVRHEDCLALLQGVENQTAFFVQRLPRQFSQDLQVSRVVSTEKTTSLQRIFQVQSAGGLPSPICGQNLRESVQTVDGRQGLIDSPKCIAVAIEL